MFADTLRFWFDRGVDGFRVDAVWPVGKHPDLPDCPPLGPGEFNPYTRFRADGHDVWRRWRRRWSTTTWPPTPTATSCSWPRPTRRSGPTSSPSTPAPTSSTSAPRSTSCSRRGTAPVVALLIAEAFAHRQAREARGPPALNNHDTQRTVTLYGRESNTTPDAWTGDNQHYPPGPVDLVVGLRAAPAPPPDCCWRCPAP